MANIDDVIPKLIGNLNKLEHLNLTSINIKECHLDLVCNNVTNLTHLDIHGISINGTIPHVIGYMNKLQYMNMDDCRYNW